MNRLFLLPLPLLAALAGCTDDDPIVCFGCQAPYAQPGTNLAEGGEIRVEHVRTLGAEATTWIHVYQFSGPSQLENAPFPSPASNGSGPFGTCVDQRDPQAATWPFKPIAGATYVDLSVVNVAGPGITATLDVPRMTPTTQLGTSTFRTYDVAYGDAFDPAYSTPDGHYTIDIGKGDPMNYVVPVDYDAPLGIGGAETIAIAAGAPLELGWPAPPATDSPRLRAFDYVVFADPAAAFAPQFICFPSLAGSASIPTAVIDALPASGLVFHARQTMYMEARETSAGELRRFDLVSSITNISRYAKQ